MANHDVIPSLDQITTGSVAPNDARMRIATIGFHGAPLIAIILVIVHYALAGLGLAPAPRSIGCAFVEGGALSLLVAVVCHVDISRRRRADAEQFRMLADIVDGAPALAPAIERLVRGAPRYGRVQRFIQDHSGALQARRAADAAIALDQAIERHRRP